MTTGRPAPDATGGDTGRRFPVNLQPPAEPPARVPPPAAPTPGQTTPPPSSKPPAIPPQPATIGRLDVPLRRQWKHIVVHHSSSDAGSEKAFDEYHKQRGWLGVGYDFVIGNGHGSADGAIEVTFRWEQQIQGAHAGVEEYNEHGIGICLVGDFERDRPTARQMASLVALTNYLQHRCQIPASNILMHRQVRATDCPGRNFPYYEYLSRLDH